MNITLQTVIFMSALALAEAQTTGTANAQGNCNAVNSGNGSTVTQTCYNVDKNLAQQISQLVAASKRDGKTLKEVLDKLDTIQKQLENDPTGTTVLSFNQQGGITAGQVNITGPAPVKVTFSTLGENVPMPDKGETIYVSTFRVELTGQVPSFLIGASAATMTDLEFLSARDGAYAVQRGSLPNGMQYKRVSNALGSWILTLRARRPERFLVDYQCEGATCLKQ